MTGNKKWEKLKSKLYKYHHNLGNVKIEEKTSAQSKKCEKGKMQQCENGKMEKFENVKIEQ